MCIPCDGVHAHFSPVASVTIALCYERSTKGMQFSLLKQTPGSLGNVGIGLLQAYPIDMFKKIILLYGKPKV